MKKFIAMMLVLALALGLCACGGEDKYAKYDYIDEMLYNGDYEGAVQAIYDLYQQEQNNGGDVGGDAGNETTEPARPTDEERELLWEYRDIVNNLNSYVTYGSISVYVDDAWVDGFRALAYYYGRLQELDVVDKWVGTQYFEDNFSGYSDINWDRQAVLDSFTIVPDMKLYQSQTKEDNMGNVSTNTRTPWDYDENGVLIRVSSPGEYYVDRISHWSNNSDACYKEYDESGRLVKETYGASTVYALVTYTYDDAGHLTNQHTKTNNGEQDFAYTCDDQGRVVLISWEGNETNKYTIEYTYDAVGHLLREEYTFYYYSSFYEAWTVSSKKIMEYVYGADGILNSGSYSEQSWNFDGDYINGKWQVTGEYITQEKVNQYSYTCDGQGRVISVTVIPGNTVRVSGDNAGEILETPNYTSATIETVYGDYYIYNPGN